MTAAPALAQDDTRPDLIVAVNNLPGSLEGIEEMGNVAVRITYSMFDSLIPSLIVAPTPTGSKPTDASLPTLTVPWATPRISRTGLLSSDRAD